MYFIPKILGSIYFTESLVVAGSIPPNRKYIETLTKRILNSNHLLLIDVLIGLIVCRTWREQTIRVADLQRKIFN